MAILHKNGFFTGRGLSVAWITLEVTMVFEITKDENCTILMSNFFSNFPHTVSSF